MGKKKITESLDVFKFACDISVSDIHAFYAAELTGHYTPQH